MLRLLCFGFAGALFLLGATVKLYLTDGSYQLVREYQVEGDRVRFYSTDRSEWEEMPLSLVDLKKTESEVKRRQEEARESAAAADAEEQALRAAKREIERIPQDPGAYMIDGEALTPLKQAEAKIVNNNRRTVLKVLSPLPVVTGKQWLEIDGLHSANVTHDPRQPFYLRLASEERFGIIRMGEHKGNRVVENLTIIPVTKDVVEEPVMVDTFRQQVGDQLYKIWPEKDLEPGEYAVVEYTEGKVNIQVWDFAYKPR